MKERDAAKKSKTAVIEPEVESAALVVVGGQSRNVGKTALAVDLIRAFPEAVWLAMKITQYGHGLCARNGAGCDCAPKDHGVALDEETDLRGRSDTSRFIAAGARRALWLRTKQGRLAEAMPLVRKELESLRSAPEARVSPSCAIIESNSLLGFLRPRLYLVVLDPTVEDFKESAARYLDRADAFVLRAEVATDWGHLPPRMRKERPVFLQRLGEPLPAPLLDLVRERLFPGR